MFPLADPGGQRVSAGVCQELWAEGTSPRALSAPPSSTIYMGYTSGGARGIEDRGTASNCCDLKLKEEELGTSRKSSPRPTVHPSFSVSWRTCLGLQEWLGTTPPCLPRESSPPVLRCSLMLSQAPSLARTRIFSQWLMGSEHL